MRIAVLADIHANAQALKAVLEDSLTQDVERYWFLGDAVGYGPEPDIPLLWLKRHIHPNDWVLGNHDAMLRDLLLPQDIATLTNDTKPTPFEIMERDREGQPTNRVLYEGHHRGELLLSEEWEATNPEPVRAVELNRAALADAKEADAYWRAEFRRERLKPRIHSLDGFDHVLVHGGQANKFLRYIYPWQLEFFIPAEFKALHAYAQKQRCPCVQWYGHTHVPTLVYARLRSPGGDMEYEAVKVLPGQTYPLETELALVNPGSVGQPRDLDRRAAYAVLDTAARTITFRRVPYDWQETAYRLKEKGYPDTLVAKLRDAPPPGDTPPEWRDHFQQAREVAG